MVNRLWQNHFGKGIVATPSNFGLLGERPTHPALLDYLARRLIEQNWSLKALHREMMLSAVYQQSSASVPANEQVDAENTWLWRSNRRRLDVESWRDSLLAASGTLDRTLGGAPGNLGDANFNRRTLYGFVSRHALDSLLRLFDFPDPNITSEKRTVTTVPLQQLFVLNGEFLMKQARQLATRRSFGRGCPRPQWPEPLGTIRPGPAGFERIHLCGLTADPARYRSMDRAGEFSPATSTDR